jgi:hypothetical protein
VLEVEFHKIEDSEPSKINLEIPLDWSSYSCISTYPFVSEFIRELPTAHTNEIFMLDTLGEFSGGIIGPLREILKKGLPAMGPRRLSCLSTSLHPE